MEYGVGHGGPFGGRTGTVEREIGRYCEVIRTLARAIARQTQSLRDVGKSAAKRSATAAPANGKARREKKDKQAGQVTILPCGSWSRTCSASITR